MKNYPETATERFDNANFHIRYCLSFIKKYIKGDILEVGAGCGSFTRNYVKPEHKNITLTELDNKNIQDLNQKFKNFKNIKILNKTINNVKNEYDTILYLHVLEHIKEDMSEVKDQLKKINGRVRDNEKELSWMKGIGGTFVFVIGVILTWLGIDK